MMTSTTLSTVAMRGSVEISPLGRPQAVDLLEDVDRLAAQLAVEPLEVLVGELARGVVGLRIADLAVLGLLSRLEVRELGLGRIACVLRGPPRSGAVTNQATSMTIAAASSSSSIGGG